MPRGQHLPSGVPQVPPFPSAYTDGLTLLPESKEAPPEAGPGEITF